MSEPASPFGSEGAARRYAAGRPDYAPLVTDLVRRLVGVMEPLRRALDVGGTGISSAVLTELARARPLPDTRYVAASAERLPFADDTFDLIAVGSALHWFQHDRFLAEASRVGRAGAWLVVHDHWFTGRMLNQPALAEWIRDNVPDPLSDAAA